MECREIYKNTEMQVFDVVQEWRGISWWGWEAAAVKKKICGKKRQWEEKVKIQPVKLRVALLNSLERCVLQVSRYINTSNNEESEHSIVAFVKCFAKRRKARLTVFQQMFLRRPTIQSYSRCVLDSRAAKMSSDDENKEPVDTERSVCTRDYKWHRETDGYSAGFAFLTDPRRPRFRMLLLQDCNEY